MRRIALVALLVLGASCGGSEEPPTAEGVVIAVDGGLADVRRFTIRTAEGSDLTFEVLGDVRFHGAGPLGHLRSHLATGAPIAVTYQTLEDGSFAAIEVDDVSG